MEISDGILPWSLIFLADLVFFLVLVSAVITAPWYKIVDTESFHVFFTAVLVTTVIWLVRSSVVSGINFHLLITTTLYLMFQWQFAFFAVILVHMAIYLIDDLSLSLVPVNVLILGGVPMLVTSGLLVFARKALPRHFFIYIFVNCFFAAALSMLAVVSITISLYYFSADTQLHQQLHNFLLFGLMISIPEAVLNGIFMSGLIAYRPAWIATFHDKYYIDGK